MQEGYQAYEGMISVRTLTLYQVIEGELEQKSVVVDQDLSSIKTDIETMKMNLSLQQRQFGSLPGRMYDGKTFNTYF